MIGAEAAKGGSRSGWALCLLKDSSYPPIKQKTEAKVYKCYLRMSDYEGINLSKTLDFSSYKCVCLASRCNRGKTSCSSR